MLIKAQAGVQPDGGRVCPVRLHPHHRPLQPWDGGEPGGGWRCGGPHLAHHRGRLLIRQGVRGGDLQEQGTPLLLRGRHPGRLRHWSAGHVHSRQPGQHQRSSVPCWTNLDIQVQLFEGYYVTC